MEDEAIVDLFLARDTAAINHTKEKFGSRLRGIAYEITEDAETAEECESDAYLQAWNAIPPHEPRDYLYPFLVHLLRNTALNRCRSRSSQKRSALIQELTDELANTLPAPNGVEDTIDDLTLRELLNAFLETLPDEARHVFIRRYWYLDPIERIAKGYGMSCGKVKSMLFRCRKKLRTYLEKEGYAI